MEPEISTHLLLASSSRVDERNEEWPSVPLRAGTAGPAAASIRPVTHTCDTGGGRESNM